MEGEVAPRATSAAALTTRMCSFPKVSQRTHMQCRNPITWSWKGRHSMPAFRSWRSSLIVWASTMRHSMRSTVIRGVVTIRKPIRMIPAPYSSRMSAPWTQCDCRTAQRHSRKPHNPIGHRSHHRLWSGMRESSNGCATARRCSAPEDYPLHDHDHVVNAAGNSRNCHRLFRFLSPIPINRSIDQLIDRQSSTSSSSSSKCNRNTRIASITRITRIT